MNYDVSHLLTRLISGQIPLRHICFATATGPAPASALQVDFPRLEIVLEGTLTDMGINGETSLMSEQDVLYIPAGGWNAPQWQKPVTMLSVLFGKQQLGFSVTHWDGAELHNLAKQHVARRGPRIGSFLLQTLHEMQMQPKEQQTARLIVASLLSHCADLLGSQIQTASRSQALFEAIRDYIDENYAMSLTRESVAQAFYISPNYLSHLWVCRQQLLLPSVSEKYGTFAVRVSSAVSQPVDGKEDYSRIRWVCCGAERSLRTALITR